MPTKAELQASLDEIETILNTGIDLISADGWQTRYDLKALQSRANELRLQIAAKSAPSQLRRVIFRRT